MCAATSQERQEPERLEASGSPGPAGAQPCPHLGLRRPASRLRVRFCSFKPRVCGALSEPPSETNSPRPSGPCEEYGSQLCALRGRTPPTPRQETFLVTRVQRPLCCYDHIRSQAQCLGRKAVDICFPQDSCLRQLLQDSGARPTKMRRVSFGAGPACSARGQRSLVHAFARSSFMQHCLPTAYHLPGMCSVEGRNHPFSCPPCCPVRSLDQ